MIILEDVFKVERLDPDGKKFDKGVGGCRYQGYLEWYPVVKAEFCPSVNLGGGRAMSRPTTVAGIGRTERPTPGGGLTAIPNVVTRIEARSERFDMFMHLDVNTEIYPMKEGQKFTMALASTLNPDGTPDTGYYTPGNRKSLADKYEYVMHGKLYKISEDDPGRASKSSGKGVKAEIYVSFGGLLMMLKGDPSNLHQFDLDQRLFLCIRKL